MRRWIARPDRFESSGRSWTNGWRVPGLDRLVADDRSVEAASSGRRQPPAPGTSAAPRGADAAVRGGVRLLPVRAGIRHLVVAGPDTSGLGAVQRRRAGRAGGGPQARRVGRVSPARGGLAPGPGPADDGRAAARADRPGRPVVPRTLAPASRWPAAFRLAARTGAVGATRAGARAAASCRQRARAGGRAHAPQGRGARGRPSRRRSRAPCASRGGCCESGSRCRSIATRGPGPAPRPRPRAFPLDRPLVAFELPHRVESALPAVAFLRRPRLRGGAHRRPARRPRRVAGRRGSGLRAAAQRRCSSSSCCSRRASWCASPPICSTPPT